MRSLWTPILLVALALAVPIVPFAVFGPSMEERIQRQLQENLPPWSVASAVVGLLTVDLLLPVPSSVVSTVAGKALGVVGGTAASWLGMTLGAAIGFALARGLGRPLAERLAGPEELDRIADAAGRFGPLVLVLARPVPVLAEASVLFLGATRLAWLRFLVPTMLSNLGIAATYAALGQLVRLPVALAASVALPLVAALIARWVWPKTMEHVQPG